MSYFDWSLVMLCKLQFPNSLYLFPILAHWARFPTAFSDVADLNTVVQMQECPALPLLQ